MIKGPENMQKQPFWYVKHSCKEEGKLSFSTAVADEIKMGINYSEETGMKK